MPTARRVKTGSPLVAFLTRRLLQTIPVIVCIAAANFVLVHLAPGDVAAVLAGQSGQASAQYVAQLRHELGLDQSLSRQFLIYLGKLASFDLGYSHVQQAPVINLILDRLPATLLLMVSAIVLAVALGIAMGVTAARRRGSIIDNAISVGALIVYATPVFWLGLMLVVLFSVEWQILPPRRHGDGRRPQRGASSRRRCPQASAPACAHPRAVLRRGLHAVDARLDARSLHAELHHDRSRQGTWRAWRRLEPCGTECIAVGRDAGRHSCSAICWAVPS